MILHRVTYRHWKVSACIESKLYEIRSVLRLGRCTAEPSHFGRWTGRNCIVKFLAAKQFIDESAVRKQYKRREEAVDACELHGCTLKCLSISELKWLCSVCLDTACEVINAGKEASQHCGTGESLRRSSFMLYPILSDSLPPFCLNSLYVYQTSTHTHIYIYILI
jgi:hypothetical protein